MLKLVRKLILMVGVLPFCASAVLSEPVEVPMVRLVSNPEVKGIGERLGTIALEDTPYGLLITPDLIGLTPGIHGFHVHSDPSCQGKLLDDGKFIAGLAAGSHLDPDETGLHLGPYNANGHLGDLPVLFVDEKGRATLPVLAPRLKIADVRNRSFVIHSGGDNYSDDPLPLGGGGHRVACGILTKGPMSTPK